MTLALTVTMTLGIESDNDTNIDSDNDTNIDSDNDTGAARGGNIRTTFKRFNACKYYNTEILFTQLLCIIIMNV